MALKELKIMKGWIFVLLFLSMLAFIASSVNVTLNTPTHLESFLVSNSVTFNCSAEDSSGLNNISLYHSIGGIFAKNQTKHWGRELDVESGNVLLMHFNNDSSYNETSVWIYDFSGNLNNGTVVNAAYTSDGGKYGGGYFFGGLNDPAYPDNDSIVIQDSASLDLTTAGTIELWVKPSLPATDSEWTLISKGDNTYDQSPYSLVLETTAGGDCKIKMYFGDTASSSSVTSNSNIDCTGSAWTYMSVTWNAIGVVRIYINGNLNLLDSTPIFPSDSSGVLRIGKNSVTGYPFNGTIDELAIFNRELSADEILRHSGLQTPESASKTWTINNIPDGAYTWNCIAYDNTSEGNWSSANSTFYVDLTPPLFSSINITPGTTDGIDPGTTINVSVGMQEPFVSAVILQYKQASSETWDNKTMVNSSLNLYESNFSSGIGGEWEYRIYANDTNSYTNVSLTYNISAEYDYTWLRSPSVFDTISGYFETNSSIGILTINNTGDYNLTFSISSDWANTFYNITSPSSIAIAAHSSKQVNITMRFNTEPREDRVQITIDATYADTNPPIAYSNITLVSYAGGPYFTAAIDSYPSEINQSRNGNLSAYVKNIGNQTSTGTWLNWTLPSGWSNITGNSSFYIGNLTVGSTSYNSITVNLSSSASAGIATITATAICNENVSDSESKTIQVSCYSGDSVCGTGCTYLTDSDCTQETITSTTGGGSGSNSAAGGGASAAKTITISKKVDVARGDSKNFTIDITNPFYGSSFENVTIKLKGFLAQYITISPNVLAGIKTNQTKKFSVTVSAPPYSKFGNYTLLADITGKVVDSAEISPTVSDLRIFQYISLIVHEVSGETASASLAFSKTAVEEMKSAGFSARKAGKLLSLAEESLAKDDYEEANKLALQVIAIKDIAFATNGLLETIRRGVQKAEQQGLSAEQTKALLSMAQAAFEREDYESAQSRAKEAEVTFVLETKGRFNLIRFIRDNWAYILAVLAVITVSGYFAKKKISIVLIKRKMALLSKEEAAILRLMGDLQAEYFEKKTLSPASYFSTMAQYHKRLTKIRAIVTRLRSKETKMLSVDKELENLERENDSVLDLIKKSQTDYFEKGTITKAEYTKEKEAEVERLAEIEEATALITAMKEKEKAFKKQDNSGHAQKLIHRIKHRNKKFYRPKGGKLWERWLGI